nr:amino acid ABC transporter permease [uncultured Cellulosilyticum sp.]
MENFFYKLLGQKTFDFYDTFINNAFYELILNGILWTLGLTIIAASVGLIIGVVVALIGFIKPSRKRGLLGKVIRVIQKILKWIASAYVYIIRGTPTTVQVIFLWTVVFAAVPSEYRIWVGGLAFGINSGAYMSELIRAGIQGIDKGQMEAGRSLGFTYAQTMKSIILPQAFKQMLPAFVSEFIVLIKETSIVGYMGGMDLTRAGNIIISRTYNAVQPLLIVAICYLILTGTLTFFMKHLEKKLNSKN